MNRVVSVPRCRLASPTRWFFAAGRGAAAAGRSFLLSMRWSAAGCGCSPPSGNWNASSWMTQCVHFLLDADQLVTETLLDVSSFHGEDWLQGVLLTPEDLDLLLVIIQLVADVLDLLLRWEGSTSSVCSLPLSDAGFEPKLFPVWSMLILLGNGSYLFIVQNKSFKDFIR